MPAGSNHSMEDDVRFMRRSLMLAAAALSLSACNSDLLSGINGSVQGTYSLRTINGVPLPYTFSTGTTLTNETLTLSSDGSFTDYAQYNSGQSSQFYGYYTENGGSIQFTLSTGGSFQGSVSGNTLTEVVNGFTQQYQRQ